MHRLSVISCPQETSSLFILESSHIWNGFGTHLAPCICILISLRLAFGDFWMPTPSYLSHLLTFVCQTLDLVLNAPGMNRLHPWAQLWEREGRPEVRMLQFLLNCDIHDGWWDAKCDLGSKDTLEWKWVHLHLLGQEKPNISRMRRHLSVAWCVNRILKCGDWVRKLTRPGLVTLATALARSCERHPCPSAELNSSLTQAPQLLVKFLPLEQQPDIVFQRVSI